MVRATCGADMDPAPRGMQANLDGRRPVIRAEDDLGIVRPGGDSGEALEQRARPLAQLVGDVAVARGNRDAHDQPPAP